MPKKLRNSCLIFFENLRQRETRMLKYMTGQALECLKFFWNFETNFEIDKK